MKNKKVYIITYYDYYSNGESVAGVSYVFNSINSARKMLETIENDEITTYHLNGQDISGLIRKDNNVLIIDGNTYTKFEIIEQEVL